MTHSSRRTGRTATVCAVAWLACSVFLSPLGAQETGESVYRSACVACHGTDGDGVPQSIVGFDVPLPDFSDCSFASREPAADWFAIAHEGGPVRAFDRRMPSFRLALSTAQIEGAVAHIKGLCDDPAWPQGELNLPRPLVTEKAYPEDEAVLTTAAASGTFVNAFLYEHRIGARSQFEVNVPVALGDDGDGWHRGLGDINVALKHVLSHSLERGRIVSVAGEVTLPTGKENEGLGKGVTIFEPFIVYGQILPRDSFLQVQAGVELPTNYDRASNEVFWRTAVGRSLVEGEFGRVWSPMIEVLGARELESGESTLWDIVPQMQVTLSRRQHIMINAGVRIPVNDRADRGTAVLTYFLWDWFDGGLFDGWR